MKKLRQREIEEMTTQIETELSLFKALHQALPEKPLASRPSGHVQPRAESWERGSATGDASEQLAETVVHQKLWSTV